jgi:hypothetical protein
MKNIPAFPQFFLSVLRQRIDYRHLINKLQYARQKAVVFTKNNKKNICCKNE